MESKKKLQIYICAHKQIKNPLPRNREYYTILAQNSGITDERLPVINIDCDFTRRYKRAYGEGCGIRWMYEHRDELPEYVGLNHYRRHFFDFVDKEENIFPIIDSGKVIAGLCIESWVKVNSNKRILELTHIRELNQVFYDCLYETYPEYKRHIDLFLDDKSFHNCCLFIMKREDFIHLYEFTFKVLELFDKKLSLTNDNDVGNLILKFVKEGKVKNDAFLINWHSRLEGFYLERLIDLFFRIHFGYNNIYVSTVNHYPHEGTKLPTYKINKVEHKNKGQRIVVKHNKKK